MDKIDSLILSELMKDSQTPFSKIAKKLGVSPETVRKRYKKMKEQRQIMLNTITIDLSKIGYQATAYLFIKTAPKNDKAEIIDFLQKVPNITTITEIIGEFNIFADAVIKDLKDFFEITNEVSRIPAVERVEFMLVNDLPSALTVPTKPPQYIRNIYCNFRQ